MYDSDTERARRAPPEPEDIPRLPVLLTFVRGFAGMVVYNNAFFTASFWPAILVYLLLMAGSPVGAWFTPLLGGAIDLGRASVPVPFLCAVLLLLPGAAIGLQTHHIVLRGLRPLDVDLAPPLDLRFLRYLLFCAILVAAMAWAGRLTGLIYGDIAGLADSWFVPRDTFNQPVPGVIDRMAYAATVAAFPLIGALLVLVPAAPAAFLFPEQARDRPLLSRAWIMGSEYAGSLLVLMAMLSGLSVITYLFAEIVPLLVADSLLFHAMALVPVTFLLVISTIWTALGLTLAYQWVLQNDPDLIAAARAEEARRRAAEPRGLRPGEAAEAVLRKLGLEDDPGVTRVRSLPRKFEERARLREPRLYN